jgi:cobalamin biosynthesis Co2+ chelatase CbiK
MKWWKHIFFIKNGGYKIVLIFSIHIIDYKNGKDIINYIDKFMKQIKNIFFDIK